LEIYDFISAEPNVGYYAESIHKYIWEIDRKCKLPISSAELINRLIEEKSTLLTPAEHFGLKEGIRVGFGYDVDKSLEGLARAEALMRTMK
jgi:aspartate/methionine/tyrosine aminotransferase